LVKQVNSQDPAAGQQGRRTFRLRDQFTPCQAPDHLHRSSRVATRFRD
jgi:hypothetical protein